MTHKCYFLQRGRVDLFSYILAGYAVLMMLVQLRLAPLYLKLVAVSRLI